ncbi:hypothetical protein L208DRAFT_1433902 [Tricholoma matsutake]|nr:hypothetical protein L208DRAFT_1433902 [Tricholoma matsutake 945]
MIRVDAVSATRDFPISSQMAEPTKTKLKRRSSRKDLEDYHLDGGQTRELEQKRSREQVSCAECRRLKIKCDKKIPCQSCQRRGCATLCPNGSLSTGQGTRFVLAATEHLHRRISKLSGRIRQLEDALAALQSRSSSDPHPLLHADLLSSDEKDEEPMMDDSSGGSGPTSDLIDAFGTLSIADHGISRFFGPTGGSERLLISCISSPTSSPRDTPTRNDSRTSGDLSLFSHSFPFTPVGSSTDIRSLIESHLPTWERAHELAGVYVQQISWFFRGITRTQLFDDMLPAIYRRHPPLPGEDYTGPHDLALLFIIFAVASLLQPDPSNALAEHFQQVSRQAMALQSVLEKPSIVTIQLLHLLSIYNAMSGVDFQSDTSMETTWSLVTLAAHLSQTIGLHRDSARWGLSPKMVQRRRIVFWCLFVADTYQSLTTGRPPSFSVAYIDCSLPEPESPAGKLSSWSTWHFRFSAQVVAEVTAKILTAEAPSYATIMELDKKVREFPIPEGSPHSASDFGASLQHCTLEHVRETILMYIHRGFFAQAIIEHPENPLKSQYAPSFLAAYRASATILKSISQQFDMWPNSTARFWIMWISGFTAGVAFGTVVTRGPRSPLAHSAMSELEKACVLFSKASVYSVRATKALSILTRLREKALYALGALQNTAADVGDTSWIKEEDAEEDELSIFAGHTRFISVKKPALTQPRDRNVKNYTPPSSQSRHPSRTNSSATSYQTTFGTTPQPPQQMMSVAAVNNWVSSVEDRRHKGGFMPLLPLDDHPQSIRYPYVPSERTHQVELSTSYGWSSQPSHHSSPSELSLPPLRHYQHASSASGPGAVPRQFGNLHYGSLLPESSLPPLDPQSPTQRYSQLLHSNPQYDLRQDQSQSFQSYAAAPTFNPQLADLGLAPRDSRLEERWSSFMQDSTLLEDINFRGNSN